VTGAAGSVPARQRRRCAHQHYNAAFRRRLRRPPPRRRTGERAVCPCCDGGQFATADCSAGVAVASSAVAAAAAGDILHRWFPLRYRRFRFRRGDCSAGP
jgi:hypothetical protein